MGKREGGGEESSREGRSDLGYDEPLRPGVTPEAPPEPLL
jgi:hypothetical protein